MSDICFLGPSRCSLTYVSAAHGTTSWLDHCLCSPSLHRLVHAAEIRFDICTDDHMPLAVTSNQVPADSPQQPCPLQVIFHLTGELRPSRIRSIILPKFATGCLHMMKSLRIFILSVVLSCDDKRHTDALVRLSEDLAQVIVHAGNKCISKHEAAHPKSVPGWNGAVRAEYAAARGAFLRSRAGGSPERALSSHRCR